MKWIRPSAPVFIFSAAILFGACHKNDPPLVATGPEHYRVSTLAGGSVGSADGAGNTATFSFPQALAVDKSGNIYVADDGNNKIRMLTPGGYVTSLAGNTHDSTGHADGIGADASFFAPVGLAFDQLGDLLVTDYLNEEIRMVTPGGLVTTVAGTAGVSASADGTGAAAYFWGPTGIAGDGKGNFFVTDQSSGKIRKIAAGGVVTTVDSGLLNPNGMTFDSKGNLFVADAGHQVIWKSAPGGKRASFAGSNGVNGYADGTGSAARFYFPTGLAIDSKDNLYVTDKENNMIRKITPGAVVTTIAGNINGAISFADGIDSAARFHSPTGIAIDQNDNIYVADAGNNAIRKIVRQ